MVLFLCLNALLITGILWAGSLFALKAMVVRDSGDLGHDAASEGKEALLEQMKSNLIRGTDNEARLVNNWLGRYAGYVQDFAFFVQRLYEEPDAYEPKYVLPPDAENSYTYTMQLSLANEMTDADALSNEIGLLGNIVHAWQPVMTYNSDIITAIYLGTESGFLINYHERSDLTNQFYNYFESSWYRIAKDADEPVFTDAYEDAFGRGLMISCSMPFCDENGNFAGVMCMDILISDLRKSIEDISFGEGSYAFLVDTTGNIIASPHMPDDGTFENVCDPDCSANEVAESIMGDMNGLQTTSGGICYSFSKIPISDWSLVVRVPESVVTSKADIIQNDIAKKTALTAEKMSKHILSAGGVSLIMFVAILAAVIFLSGHFSRRLTKPLLALRKDVEVISGGNLGRRVEVRGNDEIGDLANSFNAMTESLQKYIGDLTAMTAEKERMSAELDIAKHIQSSMLPRVFPPFPDRNEFDIFALMDPAKEVGGDFYDFFMVDKTHIAIVVADVSGKGIPAALFMVIGKTLIKDRTLPGVSLGEVFTEVNRLLCEGNSEGLFITAFEGVLDLETGLFSYVNAGHEPPYIRHCGGSFERLKTSAGFVLAGFESTVYGQGSIVLEEGDRVFLYTDGVTEATDAGQRLYGAERLHSALNAVGDAPPSLIVETVRRDVDGFVGSAPQVDDLTMLCMYFKKYIGRLLGELQLDASIENIPAATDFINGRLKGLGCNVKTLGQINIALDELLANIASYAYEGQKGSIKLKLSFSAESGKIFLTLIDNGKPFDPTKVPEPDISLSAELREPGGLGLHLVKKLMDGMQYDYYNGQNRLIVSKRIL